MKRFAGLYARLDATRSTDRKVAALVDYFREAPAHDAAWALLVLVGGRLQRLVKVRTLVEWTEHLTGLPGWLIEQSCIAAGDLAEAIALLVDASAPASAPGEGASLAVWIERLRGLAGLAADEQRALVLGWWRELPADELFLLNKLITGELRVGVSRPLVERALAEVSGLPRTTVAQRLAGAWTPTPTLIADLLSPAGVTDDPARPYPFMLAVPLESAPGALVPQPAPEAPAEPATKKRGKKAKAGPVAPVADAAAERPAIEVTDPAALGDPTAYVAEWKWDGIRAQAIRRAGKTYLWSRGDELIGDRFPELRRPLARLPDGTVLDGELLAFRGDAPLPFATLQRRIGRTKVTARIRDEAPVAFLAFDLLEHEGKDVRQEPHDARRAKLEALLAALPPEPGDEPGAFARLRLSPVHRLAAWSEAAALREDALARGAEGLILKRRAGPYRDGRPRGEWWKWKVDPFEFDAVLVAAEPGHGRRASLFTDLSFAVWRDGELVTVARAYSGLTDEELLALDRWVRRHTLETFGPVRVVEPVHVFALRCEGVARSTRHKAGLAVRFPRIARWRTDKKPAEADTLDRIEAWLPVEPERDDDRPPGPGEQLTLFPT